MMRHDVLTLLNESRASDDDGRLRKRGNRITDMHIELDPADHEEPTWEVRHPGGNRKRGLDRRTRMILGIAAVAAIVVNVGAVLAYWRITGSETAQAAAGTKVQLALRARSDLNVPLRPGHVGDLTVTVTNDNDFPIRITSVKPGRGHIVADPERRDAGCREAAVTLTDEHFHVEWDVRRNTIGAFTVPGALSMSKEAHAACDGATFTVPVQVIGVRREAS